jgi:hypothetical protein
VAGNSGKRHNDEALITALAAGGNVAAAARHAHVSERTVRRRLQDPAFRARVDEARGELVRAAVGRLAAVGALAADKLHALIGNAKSETVQLGAARSVLEYMLRGCETEVLARQLAELRLQVEGILNGHPGHDSANGEARGVPGGAAGGPRWVGGIDADAAPDPA